MKKFKLFDCWLNITLYTGFLISCLATLEGSILITGYFVIGGWQVVSMVIHEYKGWFTEKKSARRNYHWITLISVITFPVGSFVILLFVAPVMAAYYCWLCYDELYVKMQRPLSLLKWKLFLKQSSLANNRYSTSININFTDAWYTNYIIRWHLQSL